MQQKLELAYFLCLRIAHNYRHCCVSWRWSKACFILLISSDNSNTHTHARTHAQLLCKMLSYPGFEIIFLCLNTELHFLPTPFKLESAWRVPVTVSHMASQNKTGSLAHYYKQLMQVPVLGGWGICTLPTHVQLVRDVGGWNYWFIDDRLYSAILRSLEQTHCARMWFYMSD